MLVKLIGDFIHTMTGLKSPARVGTVLKSNHKCSARFVKSAEKELTHKNEVTDKNDATD